MKAKKFIVDMGILDSEWIYRKLLFIGIVEKIIIHISYYVTIMGKDDAEIDLLAEQMKNIKGHIRVKPSEEEAIITDAMQKAFDAVEALPPPGADWPKIILMKNTPIGTIQGVQHQTDVSWKWPEAPHPSYAAMSYPVGEESQMGPLSLYVYIDWLVRTYVDHRDQTLPMAIRLKAKYGFEH